MLPVEKALIGEHSGSSSLPKERTDDRRVFAINWKLDVSQIAILPSHPCTQST